MTVPQFTVKHRACSLQRGEGRWTGPGMAKLAALALAVGGFHNLSTEAAMQAAPGSLAFAPVRDSNPTSWLPLSWLWEVSICLVMDAMGTETGLDIGSYWAQRCGRNMRPEKNKLKGRRHELKRATEPLPFVAWPLPMLLALCCQGG